MTTIEMRKRLKAVENQIGKLAIERVNLGQKISENERACIHDFSEDRKSKGVIYKECLRCGLVKVAKGVKTVY